MISLKEAVKLTQSNDDEIVYLKKSGTGKYDGKYFTGRQIREKLDMAHTMVCAIDVRLDSDGQYVCMQFELAEKSK